MTSSLVVADLKGDIFRRTFYPPSLTVTAFIFAKLWRWDGGIRPSPPPPAPEEKRKPGLAMVTILQQSTYKTLR